MKALYKKIIVSKGFHRLLYALIRFYARSFRLTVVNEDAWLPLVHAGERVLICFWHQQFFPAIRYFKKYQPYRPSLMISQSMDGEIAAGVAVLSGWQPVRGSSTRGGKNALKLMIQALKQTGLAGHIVDGPRGPMGRVKAGAIRLAMSTGAYIVPCYAEADRAWFFNSWDKFFIPKPLSRVTLRFDDPQKLVPTESEADFEACRQRLERTMTRELRRPQL